MPRPKGSKNKRTILRARLARAGHQPSIEAVARASIEAMAILENAMTHFYLRATDTKRKSTKLTPKERFHDAALREAAAFAEKMLPFRHPRMATVKLTSDPNKPREDMTKDELRAEILQDMRDLGLFEDVLALPKPQGVANRDAD